jgi:gamma-glutamylcyclotransferase (GGCT)/AIG2-like uncharacterized protein YtfP
MSGSLPEFWAAYPAAKLAEVVRTLNAARVMATAADRELVDSSTDALFGASRHLIAYGSLTPGGTNARELTGLTGTWHEGWVTGDLEPSGWGAALGYPALHWDATSSNRVAAWLFVSPDLSEHWPTLDRFEGDGYRRILAPAYNDAGLLAVGYLYEIAPGPLA